MSLGVDVDISVCIELQLLDDRNIMLVTDAFVKSVMSSSGPDPYEITYIDASYTLFLFIKIERKRFVVLRALIGLLFLNWKRRCCMLYCATSVKA